MSERPRYRVHTEVSRGFVVVTVQRWHDCAPPPGNGFWRDEWDPGGGWDIGNRCRWQVAIPDRLHRLFGDTFAKRVGRAQKQAWRWIAEAQAAWDRAENALADSEDGEGA